MKRTWTYCFTLLTLLMGVSSCDNNTLLHQYSPIHQQVWNKTDTLDIPFPELPNDTTAQVFLCMRKKSQLPLKGVWIVVEQDFTNPDFKKRDTVYCRLMNDKGQPVGKGINNIVSEYEAGDLHYQKKQQGKFRIYHIMRSEYIRGITDIGLRIIALPDSVRHQSAGK